MGPVIATMSAPAQNDPETAPAGNRHMPAPPRGSLAPEIVAAADALARGEPVLVFDREGREEETDILIAGHHCTPAEVRRLRSKAGGLIFLAVDGLVGETLRLPFAQDVMDAARDQFPTLGKVTLDDLPYDARSSFSLWVNHRDTFTGITDDDRSLTIREMAKIADEALEARATDDAADLSDTFGNRFRAPGHVSLCVGHKQGLKRRHGHTELATALARIAGITPIVAGCEMLDPESGGALKRVDAAKYAQEHGFAFLDGTKLIEAYASWDPDA